MNNCCGSLQWNHQLNHHAALWYKTELSNQSNKCFTSGYTDVDFAFFALIFVERDFFFTSTKTCFHTVCHTAFERLFIHNTVCHKWKDLNTVNCHFSVAQTIWSSALRWKETENNVSEKRQQGECQWPFSALSPQLEAFSLPVLHGSLLWKRSAHWPVSFSDWK